MLDRIREWRIDRMTDRVARRPHGRAARKTYGAEDAHSFAWEPVPREGDFVFEAAHGAKVFIDPKSHRLIDGTTLDYDTSLVSRGFIFNNPNAKSTCGCGTSFSV